MQFLYPTSRQFPFDGVCENIIRELEKRNWKVPGIEVDFHEYGSGDQKLRNVNRVQGKDWKLWFCRKQCTLPGGRYNDCAAVTEIVIPKKELHVYDDESGPTFYIYVGKNWERDREKFMNGSKVNSKLNGEPRIYLSYKGSGDRSGTYTYANQRSRFLVHDNDLGREYDPRLPGRLLGREPKYFLTADVMEGFRMYLESTVLKTILAHPIPAVKEEALIPAPTPFPSSIGPIFCFGEYGDAERIEVGKTSPTELDAAERYGLSGGGYRLLPWDIEKVGAIPEKASDGFLWCGIGEVSADTPIKELDVPGHYRWSDREKFVIRITPKSADGIYIADHAAYQKRREELSKIVEAEKRERFTPKEISEFMCARARTLVPVTEYKGGYESPIVLVNRELSFDEVEVVSGPHEERRFARSA